MATDTTWLDEALKRIELMPEKAKEIRERAKQDLNYFAALVNPNYVYGGVHREIYRWMQEYTLFGKSEEITANKLIMLPRGHLKSHMVATWAAWMIVRHPEITMLYLSATAKLAETQLYAIKNILDGAAFKRYFPEYIHPQEALRERWSTTEIIIDHQERKKQTIRDATIITAGLTTNTTGWHADVIIADDLVVPENAYTEDGRESVVKKTSQFTSIRNAGGFTMACGTRYYPTDIYYTWANQKFDVYDDDGIKIDEHPVWEIKEYVVEVDGIYIWPRTVREDGKAFGFDNRVLSRIRAEYEDVVQFHAQYYNNPNEASSNRINKDCFQYYNSRFLRREGSSWYFSGKRLNVYAAVDFAYSIGKRSDYTAIVVIGIDSDSNIYVLDIDRFKVERTIHIFEHILQLHSKWGFKKLSAEVVAAQKMIVEDIKDFSKKAGLSLSVVEYRPSKVEGSKEERIAATLEWRYENHMMWHFEGGWTQVLEQELVLARPPHDDVKDALTSAVSIAVKPAHSNNSKMKDMFEKKTNINRFGGIY